MRIFPIVLCFAAVILCQSAQAYPVYKITFRFTKPGASATAFVGDRSACLDTAGHRYFYSWGGHSMLHVGYDLHAFGRCMESRGYRLDPNGYRAVFYTLAS
ncbi:MAG: hypothetical protein KGL56_13465 [Alphaproteobacteria bacterium]|nr:hypothetical protein [Alphaproteobacteria bacterium]